jgi:putative protease
LQKLYIGRVTNYFSKLGVAEIHIDTHELSMGDDILITGPTTGAPMFKVESLQVERQDVQTSLKGEDCSVALSSPVRRGDKVYKMIAV